MLKDNKVPGTSVGTTAAEAPSLGTGTAAGFLGESQAGLCERPGACLDQRGLNRRNFSKGKGKILEFSSCLENSPQQPWPLGPLPPQPLDCERGISDPSTHLKPGWQAPRSAD